MAKQTHLTVPSGATAALLPGGNKIHGPRTFRASSMTVVPGSPAGNFPGRPSKDLVRGTARGHQGMPSSGKTPSKKQSRGVIKGVVGMPEPKARGAGSASGTASRRGGR
jgi:hypothetical protein